MFLGEIFLHKNGCRLDVDNDEIVEIALRIADSSRNWGRKEIYSWLVKSCVCRKHVRGSDEHK
jgi:prophage maintenance system killer protein